MAEADPIGNGVFVNIASKDFEAEYTGVFPRPEVVGNENCSCEMTDLAEGCLNGI